MSDFKPITTQEELGRTPLSKDNIKQRLASFGIPEKFRDGYAAYIGIKNYRRMISDYMRETSQS